MKKIDQLIEGQQFIKSFVKYCVNFKRITLRNSILKQENEQKKQSQLIQSNQVPLSFLEPNCVDTKTIYLESNKINQINSKFSLSNADQQELTINLPVQFLIEIVFLAILDFDGFAIFFNFIRFKCQC
jgi:hypothetical protein